MPLKLYKRGNIFWVRGTVRGEYFNESTRIPGEHGEEAEAVRIARESEIIQRSVFGPAATVTFEEAALVYCETTNAKGTQAASIMGRSRADGSKRWNLLDAIGHKKLFEVNQELLDKLARERYPDAKPATIQRQLIGPINAVLEKASKRGWCARPNFERPKISNQRLRWLTPDEAQALLDNSAKHLKPLLLFLVGTGARLSEALELEWQDVALQDSYCHFWNTKNGTRRKAMLTPSAVAALSRLPDRKGSVFLTNKGKPYASTSRQSGGQIKHAFRRAMERGKVSHVTPHGLRHTWASWFYAMSKDLLLLRNEGGWKSASQVERYAHLVPSNYREGIAEIWGGPHPAIQTETATDDNSRAARA